MVCRSVGLALMLSLGLAVCSRGFRLKSRTAQVALAESGGLHSHSSSSPNKVLVRGENHDVWYTNDWVQRWKNIAEPSLKLDIRESSSNSAYRAWLKKYSKKYGQRAAKHPCSKKARHCSQFIVLNGKYLKGGFDSLRRTFFKKVEIWGYNGEGLDHAKRIVKYGYDGKKEFQKATIKTLSRSAYRTWLKNNANTWGKKAAKHKTSPFVVVNGRFIGGDLELNTATLVEGA